jgi:hypothetical protein
MDIFRIGGWPITRVRLRFRFKNFLYEESRSFINVCAIFGRGFEPSNKAILTAVCIKLCRVDCSLYHVALRRERWKRKKADQADAQMIKEKREPYSQGE